MFARAGMVDILDDADRTREFSPFVVRILMKSVDTVLYQAVDTVEILEVAGVAQVTRICRLVGEGMQNIDEVKWRSVM